MKGVFIGYSESPKDYGFYISLRWKIVVSMKLKIGEYAWSSRSQEPSTKVEEGETPAVPNADYKKSEISESD